MRKWNLAKSGTVAAFLPFVCLALLLLWAFAPAAFGAGGLIIDTQLSNSFDLGDISGSFWTSSDDVNQDGSYIWTQMGANVVGQHKIYAVTASFQPYYVYTYNDKGVYTKVQDGYKVTERFWGDLSTSLSLADLTANMSQQNTVDARGLYVSEFSSIFAYNSSGIGIREQGDANIAIKNFDVDHAYGQYIEPLYWLESGFQYEVNWYGDFLPGTLPAGFVAPETGVSLNAVPEPGTWALLGTGLMAGIGLVWRRFC